jgi:hypothetical protein
VARRRRLTDSPPGRGLRARSPAAAAGPAGPANGPGEYGSRAPPPAGYRRRWQFRLPLGPRAELQAHRHRCAWLTAGLSSPMSRTHGQRRKDCLV